MYVAFGYQRVTAGLRGDAWHLTWPQWRDAWLPFWSQRGRAWDALCMSRRDLEKGWQLDNIEIITRRQHGQKIREYHA